jgi:hypothetical protein
MNPLRGMLRPFVDHPREHGETYVSHLRFAWFVAGSCAAIAVVAAIHGLAPWLFKTSASRRLAILSAGIATRRNAHLSHAEPRPCAQQPAGPYQAPTDSVSRRDDPA